MNALSQDLELILDQTRDIWREIRGERLLITGGTGFFGVWLLESFCWANARLNLDATAVVLTRRREAFAAKAPHLAADPSVRFHSGDVRWFEFPEGSFSHVIHAATSASAKLNENDPLLMLDTIVQGARRTLDFAVASGARKFLLTSSGAVYGPQPSELTQIPETYGGSPDTMDPGSAYGEGKRMAELLCAIYNKRHDIETKIARCFAFVGPHLPLDSHFAIGNFIRDRLAGGPIQVQGDGTPYRSYLYAADLMIWLWTILFRGKSCCPYNVGSEDGLPIRDIARTVAESGAGKRDMQVLGIAVGGPRQRYVPCTARAHRDLSLTQLTPLGEAVKKTVGWIHE